MQVRYCCLAVLLVAGCAASGGGRGLDAGPGALDGGTDDAGAVDGGGPNDAGTDDAGGPTDGATCAPGETACAGECVDLATDARHCGTCANACGSDRACMASSCECTGGRADCMGSCVDTTGDPANCGMCGNACASDRTCTASVCACTGGRTDCMGSCVDTTGDPANCGMCGNACASDRTCTASVCACTAGRTDCGGACVDLMTDVANCGMCGLACRGGASCVGAACTGGSSMDWSPGVFPRTGGTGGFGDLVFLPNGDILMASGDRGIDRFAFPTGAHSNYATGIGSLYLLGIVWHPGTSLVYVTDGRGAMFSVTAAGASTMVHDFGTRTHSLTLAPAGFGAYGGQIIATVRDGRVFAFDPGPRRATLIGSTTADFSDAAFAPSGTLYLVDYNNDRVMTMTPAGAFSTFATGLRSPDGIAIDSSGARMWVANGNTAAQEIVQIPIPGGTPTRLMALTINFGDNVTGMLHDGARTLIYRTSSGGLGAVDPP